MKIDKIIYLQNGYFSVSYQDDVKVVQDLEAIKLTVPLDISLKYIIQFLRKIKTDKLNDEENFNDNKFRDLLVYDYTETEEFKIEAKYNSEQYKRLVKILRRNFNI